MTQSKLYTFSACPTILLHLKYDYHILILAQNPSWSCNNRS